MSEMAKEARRKMHEKAERLTRSDPVEPVDASGYRPDGALNGDVQTGERPVSRRQYKRGGKVTHAHGKHAHHHSGHAPRKRGGKALVDDYVNRDVREANEERDGIKHVGGFKRGGRAHKDVGGPLAPPISNSGRLGTFNYPNRKHGGVAHGDEAEDRALVRKMVKGKALTGKKHGGEADHWIAGAIKHPGALHRELHVPEGKKIPAKKLEKAEHSKNPTLAKRAHLAETLKHMHHKEGGAAVEKGGREARAHGGKTGKGKMNVNIIIGAGHSQPGGMMGGAPMPPPPMPKAAPVPVPPPMPSAGAMGGMPPGMPMPMPQQPPMAPRKRGGRTGYPIDAGAGGGEARLEKIRAYGHEAYD